MMLVVLSLLLGMAGLLWILVIAIRQADEKATRQNPRVPVQPSVVPTQCWSKAA